MAQASFIKKQLEEKTPHQFNLKIIKTKGDVIQDKPLWQLEGKDFFTKELDEALLNKEIDLVIHSYKDLGGDRPQGIELAAVTERVNPADTLIVTKETAKKLIAQKFEGKFRLGSSSPRRITQSQSLPKYLPQQGIEVENINLRGNVDTRLRKLLSGEYDAIILAAAGLERISYSEEGHNALKELAPQLTFMFLPLQEFVPAPAQGALAIDCHEDNLELKKVLKTVEDNITRTCVAHEKKQFQNYGGGCHLPMGIYAHSLTEGIHMVEKGKDEKEQPVHLSHLLETPSLDQFQKSLQSGSKVFLGMQGDTKGQIIYDSLMSKVSTESKGNEANVSLVATKHSLKNFQQIAPETLPVVFAAGSKSMKSLAKAGYWCHGCANSQGDQTLSVLKSSQSFNLFHDLSGEWDIYTHADSESILGKTIPSYQREIRKVQAQWTNELQKCDFFVFTSFAQYEEYTKHYPFIKNKSLYTGMGKTYNEFQKRNINCTALPSFRWVFQQLKDNNE